MNWLIARLKESSTWRGLVWLLTVAGITLNPEQTESLIVAGMAVAGLVGVLTKDKPDDLPPIELQGHPTQQRADNTANRMLNVPSNGKPESGWNG